MDAPRLTRRDFTAALGGIVLSFSLVPKVVFGQDPARLPGSLQTNRTLDAWLRINADGGVTVFTGKVELGQGIVTALAQIAAEELEVPLARVTMISGDTGQVPPKPAAQDKIVGKSAPRIDIPAKMTGGAAFVQDLRLPGMVHGRVVRPPRYGARLDSFDEARVKAMPGVIAVVRDGSFL